MLLWCPDWAVVAAEIVDGVPASGAVAVLRGNRVVACSEGARREGVRKGLRRREAQSRCPSLVVVDYDSARDARAFEAVVAAVEEVAVGVEVIRPGACALAARGPARYFGGEEAAAERIVEQVAEVCAVESQVGVAEGVFAAGLAARQGRIVAPGETPGFLAGVTVEALERPELTDLLKRLGIRTLGDFAALSAGDVLTRFGFAGALAHRLAAGQDHRPLAVRRPPPDLEVAETYDEPLERVDVAAFAGRVLAERLHERLAGHGLACTRLGIEAITADGQELHRVWRHDGMLTAAAIAERVRWQLDGWLTGARRGGPARPTAGLVRLRLVPDGVIVHLGLQPGLWGDTGAERERAHRAFSRVQGLLGPEAVVTPVLGGGRSADDQVRLVPWGDEREPARTAAPHADPVPDVVTAPILSLVAAPHPAAAEGPAAKKGAAAAEGPAAKKGAAAAEEPTAKKGAAAEKGSAPVGEDAAVLPMRARRAHKEISASPDWIAPVAQLPLRTPETPPQRQEPAAPAFPVATVRPRRHVKPPVLPPWPGRLPRPAPAMVLTQPIPAVVLDDTGTLVGVSARLDLTGAPATLVVERSEPVEITGWAGPWPVDERWWAPTEARRRARFQVALADGRALLLSLAGGYWLIEAVYD